MCCFKVIFSFLSENLSEPGNSDVVKTNFGVDLKGRLIMISLCLSVKSVCDVAVRA